jgi:endonuclease/exonuclease/phosphatase family metal-dependent hydrolase
LALLLVVAAFRLVGERWWVTTVGLYLPRPGFALPLPVLTLALLLGRAYRWLLTQIAAIVIVLFPLMGLHLSGPVTAAAGARRLRVVTLNINNGASGANNVREQLRGTGADLILLQEAAHVREDVLRVALPGYFFHKVSQFTVASRYPITDAFVPPSVTEGDTARSLRYVRYRIQTPSGPITVYNMHPISPRDALDELRGEGLRHEIASGRFLRPSWRQVPVNAQHRLIQVQAVVDDARRSDLPVIIAGDTNLPEGSWALGHWLGAYQDGFAERGRGLGYTFPATNRPWMRIDRILAGAGFRFLDCVVLRAPVSDHFGVMADLEIL